MWEVNKMNQYLIIAGITIVVILVGLFLSRDVIQKIIRIRKTPTYWISALPDAGFVEVSGKAGGNLLKSPLNHTDCVYWSVEVKEERGSGKNRHWETVYQDASNGSFEVCDETGSTYIFPESATLELNIEPVLMDDLDAAKMLGLETKGFLGFKKKFDVHESIVKSGQEVYILGEVFKDNGQKVIQMSEGPMVISNRSERALLNGYYLRVGWQFLGPITIGVVAYFAYFQRH
jgi:hypothetical protein